MFISTLMFSLVFKKYDNVRGLYITFPGCRNRSYVIKPAGNGSAVVCAPCPDMTDAVNDYFTDKFYNETDCNSRSMGLSKIYNLFQSFKLRSKIQMSKICWTQNYLICFE